jgi:hypothetical protein
MRGLVLGVVGKVFGSCCQMMNWTRVGYGCWNVMGGDGGVKIVAKWSGKGNDMMDGASHAILLDRVCLFITYMGQSQSVNPQIMFGQHTY